jgi:acyl-CoA synthetase (AMP-forming)/AMP-acid ligase II
VALRSGRGGAKAPPGRGWLHTGDVGSFETDGYLTLRDRSKDLIISGGMHIYPREVEAETVRFDPRGGRRS